MGRSVPRRLFVTAKERYVYPIHTASIANILWHDAGA